MSAVPALHGYLPDSRRESTILHLNPTHSARRSAPRLPRRSPPSAAPPRWTAPQDWCAEPSRSPSACIPLGRTSRAAAPTSGPESRSHDYIARRGRTSSRRPHEPERSIRPMDARGKRPRDPRSCGRSVVALYNARRPHRALGHRTPMQVWREGTTGALGETAVDMTLVLRTSLDNADALPTCPQPPQQQQEGLIA
jgi:hypothetical protein